MLVSGKHLRLSPLFFQNQQALYMTPKGTEIIQMIYLDWVMCSNSRTPLYVQHWTSIISVMVKHVPVHGFSMHMYVMIMIIHNYHSYIIWFLCILLMYMWCHHSSIHSSHGTCTPVHKSFPLFHTYNHHQCHTCMYVCALTHMFAIWLLICSPPVNILNGESLLIQEVEIIESSR